MYLIPVSKTRTPEKRPVKLPHPPPTLTLEYIRILYGHSAWVSTQSLVLETVMQQIDNTLFGSDLRKVRIEVTIDLKASSQLALIEGQ